MVAIKKNPLEDKKWQRNFTEALKKDIKQVQKHQSSSERIVSEIICTQKDIGEPNYSLEKKTKR